MLADRAKQREPDHPLHEPSDLLVGQNADEEVTPRRSRRLVGPVRATRDLGDPVARIVAPEFASAKVERPVRHVEEVRVRVEVTHGGRERRQRLGDGQDALHPGRALTASHVGPEAVVAARPDRLDHRRPENVKHGTRGVAALVLDPAAAIPHMPANAVDVEKSVVAGSASRWATRACPRCCSPSRDSAACAASRSPAATSSGHGRRSRRPPVGWFGSHGSRRPSGSGGNRHDASRRLRADCRTNSRSSGSRSSGWLRRSGRSTAGSVIIEEHTFLSRSFLTPPFIGVAFACWRVESVSGPGGTAGAAVVSVEQKPGQVIAADLPAPPDLEGLHGQATLRFGPAHRGDRQSELAATVARSSSGGSSRGLRRSPRCGRVVPADLAVAASLMQPMPPSLGRREPCR